jgi:uncharacterized membrane protein YebE (DUF533 family)
MAEDGLEQAELDRFADLARTGGDLDHLVARIHDPQTAAEVYIASVLAVRVDTDAERRHLAQLAEHAGLEASTVQALHRMIGLA